MMGPMFFNLDNGLSLIILPEKTENEGGKGCNFHLYYCSPDNEEKSLNDLRNYVGLISFDGASQEFYFTAGNLSITSNEILQVINSIKTKIC
jgi:hypothetical protein